VSEDILYHELREIEPSKARQLVRKVLKQTGGNVSKTARILGREGTRCGGQGRDLLRTEAEDLTTVPERQNMLWRSL